MDKIERELVDITLQEYFIDLEKRYLSYETSEEEIKKRYEKDFIKASYLTGKRLDEFTLKYNKFITFDIEGVIKIRMAIPFELAYSNGVIFSYNDALTCLKNATLKSIEFEYVKNEIIYDGMSTVLNGIRRKFINTLYKNSDRDFIEDFFENLYKKYIKDILKTLSESHFEEAEVKKYGNSYSILYRDLENFKANNPNYNDTLEEKIYTIFTKASIPFEYEKLEVEDIFFSELKPLENFIIRANMVEKELFEEFDISDQNLTDEEFNERELFIMPVIDFKNDILSIPDEDFILETGRDFCSMYGVNEKFASRIKSLENILESPIFLKAVLNHYLSLYIFFANINEIQMEIEKIKENEIEQIRISNVKENIDNKIKTEAKV